MLQHFLYLNNTDPKLFASLIVVSSVNGNLILLKTNTFPRLSDEKGRLLRAKFFSYVSVVIGKLTNVDLRKHLKGFWILLSHP